MPRAGQAAAFLAPENAAHPAIAKKRKVSGSACSFQATTPRATWPRGGAGGAGGGGTAPGWAAYGAGACCWANGLPSAGCDWGCDGDWGCGDWGCGGGGWWVVLTGS
ncbi:hypothetical protein AB0D59_09555 [Streptomyces sp. NPDC048417]|uniref:hypothetical protein n=1 Tax=Streptomyces sp. NPDC048417 TaxID=3155387 RepID=UPI00343B5BF4